MKLLVTGSRKWMDIDAIFDALNQLHRETPIEFLIEGGADGADKIAGLWADNHGIAHAKFPYAGYYGKRGGSVRNGWMLRYGLPEYVIAFPMASSVGTWNMVQQAREAGVPVIFGNELAVTPSSKKVTSAAGRRGA